MTKAPAITFHSPGYKGEWAVDYYGERIGYISRTMDAKAWSFCGRRFRYLSEAKMAVRAEYE